MKQFMVLQHLKGFSPILKGETNNLEDATTLRDVLARMSPSDTFIIVQVMQPTIIEQS